MPLTSLGGFTSISKSIYYYDPKLDGSRGRKSEPEAEGHPQVIMIFGWADANLRNLSKYTDTYTRMYPSARIILVTSSSFHALTASSEGRRQACVPAATLLLRLSESWNDDNLITEVQYPESVLIHAFSNGGMLNLVATCEAYQALVGLNAALPHNLLILDSTPGGDSIWMSMPRLWSIMATSAGKHIPVPEFVTFTMSVLFILCVVGIPGVLGFENAASWGRRKLNDPRLFTHTSRRVYMYSKADELIDWQDVEEHAVTAERGGWNVWRQCFQSSSHCQHMKMYSGSYWETVDFSWKAVMNSSM